MLDKTKDYGQVFGGNTRVKFMQGGRFYDQLSQETTEGGKLINTIDNAEKAVVYAGDDIKAAKLRFNSARLTDPEKNTQREAEMETAEAEENMARTEIAAADRAIAEFKVQVEMERIAAGRAAAEETVAAEAASPVTPAAPVEPVAPPAAPVEPVAPEVASEVTSPDTETPMDDLDEVSWREIQKRVIACGGKWENKKKGVTFLRSQKV